MNFASINDLQKDGFQGFMTVSHLQQTACREVPDQPGIYLIIWPYDASPAFLTSSIGGNFKGKAPTVSLSELIDHWVEGSKVIYIGKAGRLQGSATLRKRLWAYMKLGMGNPVGHWGGRYIWQIDGNEALQVCWKSSTDAAIAEQLEKQLI
jgi:hypothetical protein